MAQTKAFQQWLTSLNFQFSRWDQLPDIELYMDQLIIYVEKQLSGLTIKDEKIITSTMVNNYVKHGLIDKPLKKKYRRQQLADLMVISILKQVIPLPHIKTALDHMKQKDGEEKAYDQFCDLIEQALALTLQVSQLDQSKIALNGINEANLALALAAFAFASKIVAVKAIEYEGEFDE